MKKLMMWIKVACVLGIAAITQGCLAQCVTESRYADEPMHVLANIRTKIGLYQYEKDLLPCIATNEVENGYDTGKVASPQVETWISVDSKTATRPSTDHANAYLYRMASCPLPRGEPSFNGLAVSDHESGRVSKKVHFGALVDIDSQDLRGKYSNPRQFQYLVMRNGDGCFAYFVGCFGDGNVLPNGTGYAVCEIVSHKPMGKYRGVWERYVPKGHRQIGFATADPKAVTDPKSWQGCHVPEKSLFDNMSDKDRLTKLVKQMEEYGWKFN